MHRVYAYDFLLPCGSLLFFWYIHTAHFKEYHSHLPLGLDRGVLPCSRKSGCSPLSFRSDPPPLVNWQWYMALNCPESLDPTSSSSSQVLSATVYGVAKKWFLLETSTPISTSPPNILSFLLQRVFQLFTLGVSLAPGPSALRPKNIHLYS